MKISKEYFLPIVYFIGCVLAACNNKPTDDAISQKNTEKQKLPKTEVIIEDYHVYEKTKIYKLAGGKYLPYKNQVIVYNFIPMTDNKKIIRFCNGNNKLQRFNIRHELEHARKVNLTKKTHHFDARTRAKIAIINEIMAPAAERIEALENTTFLPAATKNINKCYFDVTAHTNKNSITKKINFNDQKTADIILTSATDEFFERANRGFYINTVKKEYFKRTKKLYTPSKDAIGTFGFLPQYDMWEPMWNFKTSSGQINLWTAASDAVKQKTMAKIDNLINQIANSK